MENRDDKFVTRAISNSDYDASHSTPFAALLTLVLWILCVVVGVVGFVVPYARPKLPVAAPQPTQAELIKVELTDAPIPPEIASQPATTPQPSAVKSLEIPKVPPMIAVAEPNPAVGFALPVEAPARIVDVKSASSSKPVEQTATAPVAPVQTLTFGQGEGKQPAPEYPTRARRESQEGVVLVRFTVGENGRVLSAEAVSPSPWPLLNESALSAVRERWRFGAGGLRLYEVAIRFRMR